MISAGILSEQEARDAVNWDIFITIGSAFGIGTALVNSGVAGGLANFLVTIGTSVGAGCKSLHSHIVQWGLENCYLMFTCFFLLTYFLI